MTISSSRGRWISAISTFPNKVFVLTFVAEFTSRGLLWVRILAIGVIVPVEYYGFLLVLLAIEGMLASVIAYPTIKDLLVRQNLTLVEFHNFLLLFGVACLPVVVVLLALNYDLLFIIVAITASLANGLGQVGLCVLRVADLRKHNRVKFFAVSLSTALFLCLLTVHWSFLPLVHGAGTLLVLASALKTINAHAYAPAFTPPRGYHLRGWLIYGGQAVLNNFPQYGTRLFVAATTSLPLVALYVQTYMVATALFFAFSTIMVFVEPKLSRAAEAAEVFRRLRLAVLISGIFLLLSLCYGIFVGMVLHSNISETPLLRKINVDLFLFVSLILFIGLNGIQTVMNSLVLALSGRAISLLSTVLGASILAIGLVSILPKPELAEVGAVLAIAQGVSLATLFVFIVRRRMSA